ncbi:hypothetical protein ABE099_03935 [Paenibacillus turicensis]|uniref:hypothetical protein n=1 Tax=Paenibacillus turicensis TaxID=160487 RepID=UPI003D2E1386
MYEVIDKLQESNDYYYIDYIPFLIKDPKYLDLEEFFIKTYLDSYSKKISRIMLKLIYYYNCKIYLTEPSKEFNENLEIQFNTDIRATSPEKLDDIIRKVILTDFSSVQILFSDPLFLISIGGEFSVTIFKPTDEVVENLNQLVNQEGLFLKKH